MSFVKRAMLLLLLAAVSTNADHGPCDGLNITIKAKDLHKILGDWVLVWSVANYDEGSSLLANLTSSHVELRRHKDNKTMSFIERNKFKDDSCNKYDINMTVPKDPEHDKLVAESATLEKNGVESVYNETGEAIFLEACADCMVMVYFSKDSGFLLIYKREGGHREVEKLKESHDDHKKLAACLGFPHDTIYTYDGATDFCHKKSAPEAVPAED